VTWFIFAVLMFVFGAAQAYVAWSRRRVSSDEMADVRTDSGMMAKPWIWLTGSVLSIILGLLFLAFSTVYFQDPGESKVIRGFGKDIARIDDEPGLGFKAPWETIATFNIRNQPIEMFGGGGSGNPTIGKDGAVISAPLTGSANVNISTTIVYSIKEDKVGEIYTNYGNQENLLKTALRPNIRDVIRKESARFEPFLIKERREALEKAVQTKLQRIWGPIGVKLEYINWGDFTLDKATEEALAQINTAKANAEAERNKLLGAELVAEQTRVTAKGDSDSDQIIRCGAKSAQVTEVIAGKPTKVTRVTPLPQSQCQNRLNEQVLTARYIKALELIGEKGNLIVITGANGATPLLNLPTSKKK